MSGKATTLRWSAGPRASEGSTPTIKNHTATRIGSRLFVFGGYDGVRNHHAVHVLDTETLEWREAEVHVSFHVALVFRCRFAGHSCARCPLVFFFPVSFCLLSPSPSLTFLTCVYFPDKFSNQPLLFFLDIIIKRTLYEHYTNIIRTLYKQQIVYHECNIIFNQHIRRATDLLVETVTRLRLPKVVFTLLVVGLEVVP